MAALRIDGELKPLRLTLGALARLERALGADGVDALARRLAAPRASDLLHILEALIGEPDFDATRLARADIDPAASARAIAQAFAEAEGPKPQGGMNGGTASHGPTGSSTECA
jgi:hypothetical protein